MTIGGTEGDDVLAGDRFYVGSDDRLYGLGGDDHLWGGADHNLLDGGEGSDTASYRNAPNAVEVNLGLIGEQRTGYGDDSLVIIDNLSGSRFDDTLIGDDESNLLDGGAGVDTMVAGDGSDSDYVDQLGDVVTETNDDLASGGSDTVYSSLSAYTLTANVENLRLRSTGPSDGTGNELDNTLYAGSGDNVLDGAGGSDTVSYANASAGVTVNLAHTGAQDTGGSRTDTLIGIENLIGSKYNDRLTGDGLANVLNGGLGKDLLTGGAGPDTFRFDTLLKALTNCDTISDFGSTPSRSRTPSSRPSSPVASTGNRSARVLASRALPMPPTMSSTTTAAVRCTTMSMAAEPRPRCSLPRSLARPNSATSTFS